MYLKPRIWNRPISMPVILKISGLSRIYLKGQVEIPALRDVSFEVDEGSYLSIVGKSGSGKSTLLNLVGGLDTPTEGKIEVNGEDLAEMNRYQLALHRRNAVGMIFQSFNLIQNRTAIENIMLPLIFSGVPRRQRKERAGKLLEQVGLAERINHLPSELSGGEAQRVAIARSLANEPRIILADEPTGNLDSSTGEQIMDLLAELNREGKTIIMVTHEPNIAAYAKNRLHMKDGFIDNIEKS